MSEHLFCARASAFGMTTKSATFKTKYCCSHIYHALYPCWVITLFNAVVVKVHGGCWCPNFYFCTWASVFGMTTKAATSESKYYCSHIDHMLYHCLVATLWNADMDKADGGCRCPDGYSATYKSKHYCFIYAMCDIPIEAEWRIKATSDRSSLVEMVVCRLSGGKPLFKPMLAY